MGREKVRPLPYHEPAREETGAACVRTSWLDHHARDPAADVGAAMAGFGTGLAMIVAMTLALGCTRFANVRTDPANVAQVVRTAAHESGCRPANGGTIAIQPDALGHGLDVRFVQTRLGAILAFARGIYAGLETKMILVNHGNLGIYAAKSTEWFLSPSAIRAPEESRSFCEKPSQSFTSARLFRNHLGRIPASAADLPSCDEHWGSPWTRPAVRQ